MINCHQRSINRHYSQSDGKNKVINYKFSFHLLCVCIVLVIFSNLPISETTLATACEPNPCKNGGTCQLKHHSYVCQCTERFEGSTCEGMCCM